MHALRGSPYRLLQSTRNNAPTHCAKRLFKVLSLACASVRKRQADDHSADVGTQPKTAALSQLFNIGSQVEGPHLIAKEAHRPQCSVGHYPRLGVARQIPTRQRQSPACSPNCLAHEQLRLARHPNCLAGEASRVRHFHAPNRLPLQMNQ
jgi:hypothetical protein